MGPIIFYAGALVLVGVALLGIASAFLASWKTKLGARNYPRANGR